MRNHRLPNAELLGDTLLGHSGGEQAANFSYVLGRELTLKLSAIVMRAMSYLIGSIFSVGCPSQVGSDNVLGFPVPMGNFMLRSWLRPMKGCTYEVVNKLASLTLASYRKFDGWVAAAVVRPRIKYSRSAAFVGFNATKAAHLIIGVAVDDEPDFIHDLY